MKKYSFNNMKQYSLVVGVLGIACSGMSARAATYTWADTDGWVPTTNIGNGTNALTQQVSVAGYGTMDVTVSYVPGASPGLANTNTAVVTSDSRNALPGMNAGNTYATPLEVITLITPGSTEDENIGTYTVTFSNFNFITDEFDSAVFYTHGIGGVDGAAVPEESNQAIFTAVGASQPDSWSQIGTHYTGVGQNGIPVFSTAPGQAILTTTNTGTSGSGGDMHGIFLNAGDIDGYTSIQFQWSTRRGDGMVMGFGFQDAAPIPEPSSVGMIGLAGMGLLLRRRRGC